MKCPYCDGKGTVLKIIYEDWKKDEIVRSAVKCPRCNGSGEVQTNEEYLRSLNTEQLADVIADFYLLGFTHGHNKMDITSRTKWVEWLKEKHDEMQSM